MVEPGEDQRGGATYKTAAGFGEPYGDYGETDMTSSSDDLIAALGRGPETSVPAGREH